jgi:GT2 family glycosyltransferase
MYDQESASFDVRASLVLYKTSPEQVKHVVSCVLQRGLSVEMDVIDNYGRMDYSSVISDKRVHFFRTERNIGYGRAHNTSIRKSLEAARYHLVLNPDVSFESETLETILNYMEQYPDVGQLMPRIVDPEGSLQYLCKLLPTPIDLLVRRFVPIRHIRDTLSRKFELHAFGYDQVLNVPYLSGSFMFLRISALREIGMFDERYFMYAEDIDLTRRVHGRYKTVFFPAATVIHEHARESYKRFRMMAIHIVNVVRYFNKWGWFFDRERRIINARALAAIGSVARKDTLMESRFNAATQHVSRQRLHDK